MNLYNVIPFSLIHYACYLKVKCVISVTQALLHAKAKIIPGFPKNAPHLPHQAGNPAPNSHHWSM